jgi:hypothetical protein
VTRGHDRNGQNETNHRIGAAAALPQLADMNFITSSLRSITCAPLRHSIKGYILFAVSNAARAINRFAARASTSSLPFVRTTLNGHSSANMRPPTETSPRPPPAVRREEASRRARREAGLRGGGFRRTASGGEEDGLPFRPHYGRSKDRREQSHHCRALPAVFERLRRRYPGIVIHVTQAAAFAQQYRVLA